MDIKLWVCVVLTSSFILCRGQIGQDSNVPLAGRGKGNDGQGKGLGPGMKELSPAQYAVLEDAVKTIVGPHAKPDTAIINYSRRQQGNPRTFYQMMGYMPFLKDIALNVGLEAEEITNSQELDEILYQRATKWMVQSGLMDSQSISSFRGRGQIGQDNNVPLAGRGKGNDGQGKGLGPGMKELSPAQYAVLEDAVKTIVGPHAKPDTAIINYSRRQQGNPRTFYQMMGYMPFLKDIALNVGLEAEEITNSQELDEILYQRATKWMVQSGLMDSQSISSFRGRGQIGQDNNVPLAGRGKGNDGQGKGLGPGMKELSPAQYAVLEDAVKTIVGPHAKPDTAIINYSRRQQGNPRTFYQMMGYMPFLKDIALNVGLEAEEITNSQELDEILYQRATKWMVQSGLMDSQSISSFRGRGQIGQDNNVPLAGRGKGNDGQGKGLGPGMKELSPAQYAVLEDAVKTIVGPHAKPDTAIINYSRRQQGNPRTFYQMMGYMPFLIDIARNQGLKGGEITNSQGLDEIVYQRATEWMNQSGLMNSQSISSFL